MSTVIFILDAVLKALVPILVALMFVRKLHSQEMKAFKKENK